MEKLVMKKIVVDRDFLSNEDLVAVMEVLDRGVDYEITRSNLVIDFTEFEDEMSVFDYMLDELEFSMDETLTLMEENVEGGYEDFVEDVRIRFGM